MNWRHGKANTALILDTHVLLWFLYADPRLTPRHLDMLREKETELYVSAVSAFEVANKARIKKLPDANIIVTSFVNLVTDFSIRELPLRFEHARLAGELTAAHKDPFDRCIAAQAIVENMDVMTADSAIKDFGARVVW
jgi:PIN domain nuclease of toxin-antitoxin system